MQDSVWDVRLTIQPNCNRLRHASFGEARPHAFFTFLSSSFLYLAFYRALCSLLKQTHTANNASEAATASRTEGYLGTPNRNSSCGGVTKPLRLRVSLSRDVRLAIQPCFKTAQRPLNPALVFSSDAGHEWVRPAPSLGQDSRWLSNI